MNNFRDQLLYVLLTWSRPRLVFVRLSDAGCDVLPRGSADGVSAGQWSHGQDGSLYAGRRWGHRVNQHRKAGKVRTGSFDGWGCHQHGCIGVTENINRDRGLVIREMCGPAAEARGLINTGRPGRLRWGHVMVGADTKVVAVVWPNNRRDGGGGHRVS